MAIVSNISHYNVLHTTRKRISDSRPKRDELDGWVVLSDLKCTAFVQRKTPRVHHTLDIASACFCAYMHIYIITKTYYVYYIHRNTTDERVPSVNL